MAWFSWRKPAAEAKKTAPQRYRGFDAAQISRLTSTWTRSSVSIDSDLLGKLEILRARSRDMANNDPYAKKFLQMCQTNIVGPSGFAIQVRPRRDDGSVDNLDGDAIERAFETWSKRRNCSMTGRLSFGGICNQIVRSAARDGEWLVRKYRGPAYGPFGFKLHILDVDRIVTQKNEELKGGGIIRMGVELSPMGAPVAYHLHTKHPGDNTYYDYRHGQIERVPAADISHEFLLDRPEQTRGVPWMYAAMKRMWDLNGYDEAAILAARVGASKMGFWTTPDGTGSALADGSEADGTLFTEAEPGVFGVAPSGYGFETFDPAYPAQAYESFVKSCLRGIASGLGVAYNDLSNDLENVNFSSIRAGTLAERDTWMVLQRWVIESFCEEIFSEWLSMGLLMGSITGPTGKPLPSGKFDKFDAATFRGRRWQWVDPRADMEAASRAVSEGFKSRRDVVNEMGGDIDDVWAQLAREQQDAAALGLNLGPPEKVNQIVEDAP